MPGAELITLFGDQLEEVDSARIGMRVSGGQKVSMRDVAVMLFALSVAELLDSGAATVTEQEVKKRFRTRKTMLLKSAPAGDGFTAIVATAARDGVAVEDLGLVVLGGMTPAPETSLIRGAQGLLEPTGAVVRSDEGRARRIGTKLGANPYEIRDDQAELLKGEWQQLHQRWTTWKTQNPALGAQLLDSCRKALDNAKQPVD